MFRADSPERHLNPWTLPFRAREHKRLGLPAWQGQYRDCLLNTHSATHTACSMLTLLCTLPAQCSLYYTHCLPMLTLLHTLPANAHSATHTACQCSLCYAHCLLSAHSATHTACQCSLCYTHCLPMLTLLCTLPAQCSLCYVHGLLNAHSAMHMALLSAHSATHTACRCSLCCTCCLPMLTLLHTLPAQCSLCYTHCLPMLTLLHAQKQRKQRSINEKWAKFSV